MVAMSLDARSLEKLSRDELIGHARKLGVSRPELLTRVELTDEILRLTIADEGRRKKARGWLGVARDLVASVVERGLELPEAAKIIRGETDLSEGPAQRPVATVTLAEIYAAQGHLDRALSMVEEVLSKEPEHETAKRLRLRFLEEARRQDEPPPPSRRAKRAEPEPPPPSEPSRSSEPPPPPASEPAAAAEPAPPSVAEPTPAPPSAAEPTPAPPVSSSQPRPVDAVVTIRVDPLNTYVYWELRPDTLARARSREPGGRAVVRVVTMQPTWDGARRIERSVDVDSLQGSALVDGFGDDSVVRAAAGWQDGDSFRVLAVASEIGLPGPGPLHGVEVFWQPRPRAAAPSDAHLRAIAVLKESERRSRPSAS